ncbi:transposase [Halotia branconii]|uniref:transposase n=1 Tax=Halotia branconii TaxID=1620816 RepID=UPI003CCF52E8
MDNHPSKSNSCSEAIKIDRPLCPRCQGLQVYKNGSNILVDGSIVQRWFCQQCRKTFQPSA